MPRLYTAKDLSCHANVISRSFQNGELETLLKKPFLGEFSIVKVATSYLSNKVMARTHE